MKSEGGTLRAYVDWVILNLLWIPLTLQDAALMTIAVPAALLHLAPDSYRATLSVLVSVSSLGAMIVPPFAGWLSDHQHRRGKPRHPFVLLGVAVDVGCLIGLAFAHNVFVFGALLVCAIAGTNISIASYQAMLPEVVPRKNWGIVSGVRGVMTLAGTIVGLATASVASPAMAFIVTAAIMFFAAFSLLGIPSAPYVREESAEVKNWHDFRIVFVARALVFFGLTLLMTFVLFFFTDILKVRDPSQGTGFVALASLGGALVSSVWLGIVSDRAPRRIVVACAGVPMAIAAAGFAVAPDPRWMFVFATFFGAGLGGVLSTGWALAMDTVPAFRDVARDLGLWGIASNLPNVLAPLVGGGILTFFHGARTGYQIIFALAGCSFALASLTVLRVGTYPHSPFWLVPFRAVAILARYVHAHTAFRIRGWGALPRRRGATLILFDGRHDAEVKMVLARIAFQSAWRDPIYSASPSTQRADASKSSWVASLVHRYKAVALGRLPYRVDHDGIAPLESILRGGGTLHLPINGVLEHVSSLAPIYVAAVSYDVFAPGRPSLLYRLANVPPDRGFDNVEASLRPVTTSQVVASALRSMDATFHVDEVEAAVRERLERIGETLFVDPELREDTHRCVRRAIAQLCSLAMLESLDGERYCLTHQRRHPEFADIDDMIAHQADLYAQAAGAARC